MKKCPLGVIMAIVAMALVMNSCQEDEMVTHMQTADNTALVIHALKSAGNETGCIDLNNPVYFKQTLEQVVNWGNKKKPFSKTVTIVLYNTETDFVIEVMSTDGWANLILDGVSVWGQGKVSPSSWGVYSYPLSEGWGAGDQVVHQLKVAGNGPQACFDISYTLVGICTTQFGSMTDNEGKNYETVVVGELEWMRDNLGTLHFNNGEEIPTNLTDEEWQAYSGPAAEIYYPSEGWGEQYHLTYDEVHMYYGALYNYKAVTDERGICPEGWRVPTLSDWQNLYTSVEANDPVDMGNQLKSTRTGTLVDGEWLGDHPYWCIEDPIYAGTDNHGFSAIPGGHRNQWGGFGNLGMEAHYWTSTILDATSAWAFGMRWTQTDLYQFSETQLRAFSVRCVKDVQ